MITRDDQIVESGVLDLPPTSLGKPRITSLLVAFLLQVRAIEFAAWDTISGRLLDNATHAQLDTLGEIVGEPRYARGDGLYRVAIKGRILANRSGGQLRTLITLLALLLPDNAPEVREGSNAVKFTLPGIPDVATVRAAGALVSAARPAGIPIAIAINVANDGLRLAGPVATLDGLGWTGAQGFGGALAWTAYTG